MSDLLTPFCIGYGMKKGDDSYELLDNSVIIIVL